MHSPLLKKNRIVQVETTTRCCETCSHCTRALAQSPRLDMPLDLFEQAVIACKDWIIRERGTLALFGGNATLWPHFDEGCAILARHLPPERMGLWTNSLHGKGEVVRKYLGSRAMYNVVVHGRKAAADEFRRELPWVRVHGDTPLEGGGFASHASLFIASQDVLPDRDAIWKAVDHCYYDINWSAIVMLQPPQYQTLGGFSCEIAGTHARVNGMPLGVEVKPGWLDLPLDAFRHQYEYACPRCGGCLNLEGVPDVGSGQRDQFSRSNAHVAQLTWSKRREIEMVETAQANVHRPTDYLMREPVKA